MDRQFTTMLRLVLATNLDLINFIQISSRCSRKLLPILVSLNVMHINFMSLGNKIFHHQTEVGMSRFNDYR